MNRTIAIDYGGWGDSGNWNAPKVLSLTATTVKIARTTSDGIWAYSNDHAGQNHALRQDRHGAQEQYRHSLHLAGLTGARRPA